MDVNVSCYVTNIYIYIYIYINLFHIFNTYSNIYLNIIYDFNHIIKIRGLFKKKKKKKKKILNKH